MPSVRGDDDGTVGYGVFGRSDSNKGVVGESDTGPGVAGYSNTNYGVSGESGNGPGVYGRSNSREGVLGHSDDNVGVFGESNNSYALYGRSNLGAGVYGVSIYDCGVVASSSRTYALWVSGVVSGYAALLEGRVNMIGDVYMYGPVSITGPLSKPGGSFKIDHPLDPANKYLSHSFVESPDMKNIYDGVVVLDDKGEAEIELPDWFGALNKDFRYQLTAIAAPGPNLYISEEISDGATTTSYYYSNSSNSSNSNKNKNNNNSTRFKVAGGASTMKVSWQVTGIRKDPWANAHRISVGEDKPAKERGYYTYPELYGQPEEKGISRLLFPTEEQERKKKKIMSWS